MQKLSTLKLIYGEELAEKVATARLLVVGAGGIGCEVMKTLSVTGFTQVDLDTIDVSNLNRQFLFRKEHVDKSKAEVVRDQIMRQNPQMQVVAYVGRIQEDRFGFKFFSEFDLVINALDNEEARKHVNNMCFNLNIPLVDSGTNGYAAQCIPICKGKTQCYQCVDRPKDQSFPVCTIRQKPEKLIHCIVWAKALYEGLFGPKEQSNNIIEDIIAEITKSAQGDDRLSFSQVVFDRVFGHEVQVLIDNISAKLQHQETPPSDDQDSDKAFIEKINPLKFESFKGSVEGTLADSKNLLNQESASDELSMRVLSLGDHIYLFVKSILRIHEERKAEIGSLNFNKDDDLCVEFVSAAANIRAHNFSISLESKFKIKEMAGKIIPAISSSNAMVAALQVHESIKILGQRYDQLQGVVYQRLDSQRLQSYKRLNDPPNPDCPICTDDSKWIYSVQVRDLSAFTLGDLVKRVIHDEWALTQALIEFNNDILYEEGDDIDEDELEIYLKRMKRPLSDLKVRDLAILQVQGTLEGKEVKIYTQITEEAKDVPEGSQYSSKLLKRGGLKQEVQSKPALNAVSKAPIGNVGKDGEVDISDSEDDLELIKDSESVVGVKRLAPVGVSPDADVEDSSSQAKRARVESLE